MALLDHDWPDSAASASIDDQRLDRHWTAFLAAGNDNLEKDVTPGDDRADELDCLRHTLPPAQLAAAAHRARQLGIGADQVLIGAGAIHEASYLKRLAQFNGLAVEDFADVDRHDTPLYDGQIALAAQAGILPLRQDGHLIWVLAPRRLTARTLCQLLAKYPDVRRNARVATSAALQGFLQRHGGPALARLATHGLANRFPALSAAPTERDRPLWRQRLSRAAGVAALLLLPPLLLGHAWGVMLALVFLAFVAFRLVGCIWPRQTSPQFQRLPDHQLPTYTVIAALHREAKSVGPLLKAILALDYPAEKLDIILAVEPDDAATRDAIARHGPLPQLRVVMAHPVGPRTKPKALNCALPYARGSLLAVFDAEDRPEPGQLRAALDAFRRGGGGLGCVQARLCIDNLSQSWLSRMFAAEYAGQFDAFLPGVAELGLPLPLGGSSNHFRTDVLRDIGAWDPYNVTEDADLGFRLARFGYRSAMIGSTTFEEAPIRFGGWLRQRTRWMKGWIQTWCVHMRQPRQFWRDAGSRGVLTLNLAVSGSVLTALAHPVLLVELLASLPAFAAAPGWSPASAYHTLHGLAIAAGYVSTIVVGIIGLRQRGRLRDGWILALTPFYWVCLSIAAWRALAQFVWNPYRWEKTEHGLARRASRPPIKDNA